MDTPRNTIKNTIKIPAIELKNQPDADIKTKVARKLLSFFRKGTCFLFQSTAENFGKVFYCIFRNTRGVLRKLPLFGVVQTQKSCHEKDTNRKQGLLQVYDDRKKIRRGWRA